MRHPAAQKCTALLCLVAIALWQVVVGAMGVACEDASGKVRIELACARTLDGSCITRCGQQAEDSHDSSSCDDGSPKTPHAPHPCKDTPIREAASAAKLAPRAVTLDAVQWCAFLAVLAQQVSVEGVTLPARSRPAEAIPRPPGEIDHLRTVILLV